jgi:hypothetical protein
MPPAATTPTAGNAIAQAGVPPESSDSSTDARRAVSSVAVVTGAAVLFVLFDEVVVEPIVVVDRLVVVALLVVDATALVEVTEPVGAVALVALGGGVELDDVVDAGTAMVDVVEVGTAATISSTGAGSLEPWGPVQWTTSPVEYVWFTGMAT